MKYFALIITAFLGMAYTAIAGDAIYIDDKQMEPVPEMKDWSIEIGSGIQFSNIRTDDAYDTTFVPIDLTLELAVDDISLTDWRRGYTSFFFRGNYSAVTWGVEDYIAGFSVGPRYNFTPEGWVDESGYGLVPFIGAEVGVAFADSDPQPLPNGDQRGLGQDFNFMFGVEAGFRYDFDDTFFMRFSALYRHYSNAGLSEPGFQNEAIDSVGPQVTFGVHF